MSKSRNERVADLGARGMAHKCRLKLGRSQAMPSNIEHVYSITTMKGNRAMHAVRTVDAANDPDVAVLVAVGAIAREVETLVRPHVSHEVPNQVVSPCGCRQERMSHRS